MFGGLITEAQFLNGVALVLGAGLIFSGVRAIRRREVEADSLANVHRLGFFRLIST